MFVYVSTGVNVRYWLVNVALANVQVGVSGYGSASPAPFALAECRVDRPVNVPNLLKATIIPQRSAAQYGQYSAPMYSISGLPFSVSAVPLIDSGVAIIPLPAPTVFRVLAGTLVTVLTTAARAEPVGPLEELSDPEPEPEVSLTTTKTSTTTRTTRMLPDAIRIRLRCSARRAAACCAAIFSRREGSTLALLALPMFALSNLVTPSGGQASAAGFRTRACAAE